MVKFEDFSKQTLIEVIRQKLWSREKETLLECSCIEYRIKHQKISKEVDGLISENESLSTSLTDMVKWRENQKKSMRFSINSNHCIRILKNKVQI